MTRRLDVRLIKQAVAAEFGITVDTLDSADRGARAVLPRHIAMYLASQLTAQSPRRIGMWFGGRDRNTVKFACAKIARSVDIDITARLAALSTRLEAHHG